VSARQVGGTKGMPRFSARPGPPALEAATTGAAQVAVKEMMAQLQPWIEREKAEHIKRIVAIAKRGFRRIEKLWDENAVREAREESLAAATIDKHDAIIRRNLGMNESPGRSCSLNVAVLLPGGRTITSPQQSMDQSGGESISLERRAME